MQNINRRQDGPFFWKVSYDSVIKVDNYNSEKNAMLIVVVVIVVGGACEALTKSRQGKITIKSGKMAERLCMLLCRPVGMTVTPLTSRLIHAVGQP
jgi:hypothetical protein